QHVPRAAAANAREPVVLIEHDAVPAESPHEARAVELRIKLRKALPPQRIAVLADQPRQPREEVAFVREDRDVRMPVQQVAQELRAGSRHSDDAENRRATVSAHARSILMRVRKVVPPEMRLK